jgi:ATP-dependent helicase HrpA
MLPMDPRLARIVLAGQARGALHEALVICAALSVQDPRERPMEATAEADRCHARFADARSDFVALLNLWNYLQNQVRQLSSARFRKRCKAEYLSWTRVREWRDVFRQVRDQALAMGMRPNSDPASYRCLHQALLSGLLDQVGGRDEREGYIGPRGRRFHLFPGSGLSSRGPKWLMAAELVETSRLFARTAAAVEPEWIEQAAGHLVKRSYGSVRWEQRSGRVRADESVTLYGLQLVARRRVDYARIDPVVAREIFIREALVEGHYARQLPFLTHNRALLAEVALLETKSRRPDILVEPEQLFAFYDERIPAQVIDASGFERWRKGVEREQPKLLFFSRNQLMSRAALEVSAERFPDHWQMGELRLPLSYHFDPSSELDGVTVTLPAPLLPGIDAYQFEWLVPGLLEEKIAALIRTLPKAVRKHFVPAPDFARVCVESINPGEGRLTDAMAAVLERVTGVSVTSDAWRIEQLPAHLQMRFCVVDEHGEALISSRDPGALHRSVADEHLDLGPAAATDEPSGKVSKEWTFGTLACTEQVQRGGVLMTAYPALAVCEDGVGVRLYTTPAEADAAMRAGLESLVRLHCSRRFKQLTRALPGIDVMCLQYRTLGSCSELRQDLVTAILRQAFFDREVLPRDKTGFDALVNRGLVRVADAVERLCPLVQEILTLFHELNRGTKTTVAPAMIPLYSDLRSQLDQLVHAGFVASVPQRWLESYPRYLRGMTLRLEKLRLDPGRDRQRLQRVAPHWRSLLEKLADANTRGALDPALERYRWLLEEFRISVFAQELGTAVPVSEKRLAEQWRTLG